MRWVTHQPKEWQGGDIRHRTVFAWRPTEVGRYTVWLERFWITERGKQSLNGDPIEWIEIERNLCTFS